MQSKNLEQFMGINPFKPFVIETDSGKRIKVKHPDFLMISPDRKTAVVFDTNSKFNLLDTQNISSISVE